VEGQSCAAARQKTRTLPARDPGASAHPVKRWDFDKPYLGPKDCKHRRSQASPRDMRKQARLSLPYTPLSKFASLRWISQPEPLRTRVITQRAMTLGLPGAPGIQVVT
jgi:hypothetical protein